MSTLLPFSDVEVHPAVVTILFVALFIGGGVAINIYPFGFICPSAFG
jgi:hypothetical protein